MRTSSGIIVAADTGIPRERILGGTTAWAPLTVVSATLDVNSVIEELHFKITGAVTLAGYTTQPTVSPTGIEDLIRQVSFTSSAKFAGAQAVNFSAVDPMFHRLKTAMVQNTYPDRTTIGNANGTYNFETNFTKFFRARGTEVGGLTALDARLLQALKVDFYTRDSSALFSNPGIAGTATLSNVVITISVKEKQGAVTNQPAHPFVRETMRSFDLSNLAGIDKDFLNIPLGNRLMRQFFRFTSGPTNFSTGSDIVAATTLKSEGAHIKTIVNGNGGTMTRFDDSYAHIQTKNRARYKLEQWLPGWAVINYAQSGRVADMLDLRSVINAKNQVDITTPGGVTNTLTIYDEELVNG